jgi:integrase
MPSERDVAVAKITKSAVDRLSLGEVLWDTEVKGLGVRRHTTEAKHYVLRYRFNGRQTFKKIGRHGSPFTPETARKEAKRLLGLVAAGTKPANERERSVETTYGAEVERYLAKRKGVLKPLSFKQVEFRLTKHGKPLHKLALSEIDRRAIAQLLNEVESGSGPSARNRVRTTLFTFFGWLVKEGLLEINPVANTSRATEARSRERVLTEAELAEVWAALGDDGFGDVVRLLILTAQRRDEIGSLRWSEIDFDRAFLVLPPARTKNNRTHELPLSAQALAILKRRAAEAKAVNKANDARVFSGFGLSGRKKKLVQALLELRRETDRKAKPMPEWRLHDLRRTAATMMADKLGVLPHIIEAILNHVSGHKAGVAGIYNRAKYEAEMREALVTWADYVDAITSPLRQKAVLVRAIPLEQVEADLPRASFAERLAQAAK